MRRTKTRLPRRRAQSHPFIAGGGRWQPRTLPDETPHPQSAEAQARWKRLCPACGLWHPRCDHGDRRCSCVKSLQHVYAETNTRLTAQRIAWELSVAGLERLRELARRALPYVETQTGGGGDIRAETLAASIRVALQETGGIVCPCGTPLDIRPALGHWPVCPKCNPGMAAEAGA